MLLYTETGFVFRISLCPHASEKNMINPQVLLNLSKRFHIKDKIRNHMIHRLIIALSIIVPLHGYTVHTDIKKIDANKQEIVVTFTSNPGEYLYKDSLTLTVNNPHVQLSEVRPSATATSFFDKKLNRQREGYTGTVTFSTIAKSDNPQDTPEAIVHAHFQVSSSKEFKEILIPIPFSERVKQASSSRTVTQEAPKPGTAVTTQTAPSCDVEPSLLSSFMTKSINYVHTFIHSGKDTLSSLFTSTGSSLIRLVAALLLGIMLSLTPCIYPMIPITVGILQASGTNSAVNNFLLALAYTLGISTTFALLGLVAAVGSCVFGEMQGSPFIVIPIALLLIYFGLAMLDIINLYIPRFLQPKTSKVKGGSLSSAYIFGAISGTIASPCLSPGLILILNYVTTITHSSYMGYAEGLLLLFIFGIGSSLPLLIIGTFSGSLNLLPKAGTWMVEIKKLVGIMLIAMAFYHLSHLERLAPWYIVVWAAVISFFVLGIYYFAGIDPREKKWMKRYKNFMGAALIVTACILAVHGERALHQHLYPSEQQSLWLHDYEAAHKQALQENKLLFVDIGATYCSACKHLDKQIFQQKKIVEALNLFVPLKIESDVHTTSYEKLKELYGIYITGFPTYLIINPKTGAVIKKWSVEIDELSIDGIVEQLKKFAREESISSTMP